MNHFINTSATDLARARTVSLLNTLPAPFPVLTVGSQTEHKFFFTTNGAIDTNIDPTTNVLRVTIGDVAAAQTNGVFSLTIGATDPITLRWDIDAPGLQNALNSNSSIIASGGVDVSRQGDGQFLIAYRAVGAVATIIFNGKLLVPDCTITSLVLTEGTSTARQFLMVTIARVVPLQTTTFTAIVSPYAGYEGYLRLSSSAAMELVRMNGVRRGNFIECQTVINVETIDTSGNITPYYQSPVLLRALNYALESLTPTPPVVAFTQYFFARPTIVGLASNVASTTLLAGLTTTTDSYPVGCTVQCQFGNDVVSNFIRKSSTVAQNVPFVVRPYDYNATTNPYQWVLDTVTKQGVPATYDTTTGLWTYIVTVGNTNAISVASDQTGFSLPS
jgi:hypothetical protein